jgi:hypothetical protein
MADFRDLEARGVPEHLWPDDAFQQKYTKDFIMGLVHDGALTQNVHIPDKEAGKPKKGRKMPVRLEFEQRFMLDARRRDDILDQLSVPDTQAPIRAPKPGILAHAIRQFYTEDDRLRYSGPTWDSDKNIVIPETYVKEKKKSLRLGLPFSANSEEETEVSAFDFETGWQTSSKRLQKIRYQVPNETHPDHRTVVDFFYTNQFPQHGYSYIYAVSAEDELIIDNTIEGRELAFEFTLPTYLMQYLMFKVDSRDPNMKIFRSANMIDTRESIKEFERAISQWYECESA